MSCTPLGMEILREAARRAGMTVSQYVREEVLAGAGGRDTTHRALAGTVSTEAWTELLARIEVAVASPASRGQQANMAGVGLTEALHALFNARAEEMLRLGREADLRELLTHVTGAERAGRICDAVKERVTRARSRRP